MNPTGRDLHIDQALTNVSVKYKNGTFVADKLYPELKVNKDTNVYFEYGKQDMRVFKTNRAPGTRAHEVDWKVAASTNYTVRAHALEMKLVDEIRDNADEPIRYDADSTEYVTEMLALDLEKTIADYAQSYSHFGDGTGAGAASHYYSLSADDKWSNYENSNPLKLVSAIRSVIRKAVFVKPNTMIISDDVYEILTEHPLIKEMIKYTVPGGVVDEAVLAKLFKIQNLYIAGSGYISTAEGQTETLSDVWSNCVVLAYTEPNPGIKKISFGYLFRRNGFRMVERWREDAIKSDWIRVEDKYDIRDIASYAGYLLKNVIA